MIKFVQKANIKHLLRLIRFINFVKIREKTSKNISQI